MTYQTYTGTWLKNAYVDPKAALVHTADPAHAGEGGDAASDPGAYAYQAPTLTESGPVGQYPGSEWVVVSAPTTVIDHSDYESHEGDGSPAVDKGAAHQGYYAVPPTQFANEHYRSDRFEGLPGQTVNPVALQRGLNSLPQNNPEGFERGHVEQFWVDRKFAVGKRVHDQRIVTPNTAAHATETPPIPTPTGSPFSSLARAMTRGFQRPELRRPPQRMSEDLETEPAPIQPAPIQSWVVI